MNPCYLRDYTLIDSIPGAGFVTEPHPVNPEVIDFYAAKGCSQRHSPGEEI